MPRRLVPFLLLVPLCASAQPLEVVSGGDLDAWRALEEQRLEGDAAVEACRAFIRSYPTSSLAELAWRRLHALDGHTGAWTEEPGLRPHLASLERSRLQHEAALSRVPAAIAVAPLTVDGGAVETEAPGWQARVGAGLGWTGAHPIGAFGVRVDKGPLGLAARLGRNGHWFFEGAARVTAPLIAHPFGEVALDSAGRAEARAGATLPLPADLDLEGSIGVAHDRGLGPALRVEILHRL